MKAVFLDIDGTIIIHNVGPLLEDLKAIEKAHTLGHKIFLNTGRSLGNIPIALQKASWLDGMACGCGAHIIINGKTIHHKLVPEDMLCAISAYYLKNKKWCVFEGENALYGVNHYDPQVFWTAALPVRHDDDFKTIYKGAAVTKLTMEGEISAADRELMGGFFDLAQFPGYCDAVIKGGSKVTGMLAITKALGLSPEDSIAIGDSVNDIGVIKAAGFGIAMGNGSDDLKAAADAVTDTWEEHGVASALKRWVL